VIGCGGKEKKGKKSSTKYYCKGEKNMHTPQGGQKNIREKKWKIKIPHPNFLMVDP